MIEITSTTDITTCVSFSLAGPTKIRADDLSDGDTVTLYEERVDGDYEPCKNNGVRICLSKINPSILFEGYGNYKCLSNRVGIGVGYEN